MRYAFTCYTPAYASEQPQPQLPPAVASSHEEQQYLGLVAELVKEGVLRCVQGRACGKPQGTHLLGVEPAALDALNVDLALLRIADHGRVRCVWLVA